MKTKIILGLFLALGVSSVQGQSAREEICKNHCVSGGKYLAYPTPTKSLTPAPEGKSAFYLSHYGRHGSRYLATQDKYDIPFSLLKKASKAGCLTKRGTRLLKEVEMMYNESWKRVGDLTELGAEQHHEIARRMFNNFPEIFKGDAHIDAKSTTTIRCILSMENELQEFVTLNPKLRITHDASEHDMYYMKFTDKKLQAECYNDTIKNFLQNWKKDNLHPELFLQKIFSNKDWVKENIEPTKFYVYIFEFANILQNSELRKKINLYDLFTEDELYALWQLQNLEWFIEKAYCSLNGARQSFSQRYLLKNIVETADSCLRLEKPGATLRFGHDTRVMPLVCLLNLNGYGKTMHPSELIKNNWCNYRIVPMACNVQFIFYRENPQDKDVWVKVLLNEEEATLPLKAVSGPYYRWEDVRKYCLDTYNICEQSVKNNK